MSIKNNMLCFLGVDAEKTGVEEGGVFDQEKPWFSEKATYNGFTLLGSEGQE